MLDIIISFEVLFPISVIIILIYGVVWGNTNVLVHSDKETQNTRSMSEALIEIKRK